MRTLDRDLQVTAAAAVVCAAVDVSVPVTAVRTVFAVPLCLMLPGYALAAASFARTPFGGLRRLMLVPALSMAALALGAVLLDLVPSGLDLGSWAVLLVALVLIGCVVAGVRRIPGESAPIKLRRPPLRPRDVGLLLLAAVGAAAALTASRIPLPAPNAIGYTQLWMLSAGSPVAPAVHIGLKSGQKVNTTYRVVVAIGSSRPTVVESHLRLHPGAGIELNVPLSGVPGPESIVAARLYTGGSNRVYRQVTALISSVLPARSRSAPAKTRSGTAKKARRVGHSKLTRARPRRGHR